MRTFTRLTSRLLVVLLAMSVALPAQAAGPNFIYLPLIGSACAAVGGSYNQGLAIQVDADNPPRPTATWIGKNLRYRGYLDVTGQAGFTPNLIDYGPSSRDNANTPPQFDTLFNPTRYPSSVVALNNMKYYRVYDWNTSSPSYPDPSTRGAPITTPIITALGLPVARGETIYTPISSIALNPGVAAMVMYADNNTVTLAYHRQDSAGPWGYTVYIDGLCTDPNLVALYNSLDANPKRHTFNGVGSETYNLPYLSSHQAIGTAAGTNLVIAIVDSGPLMDPRSCQGWWLDRFNNGADPCPVRGVGGVN